MSEPCEFVFVPMKLTVQDWNLVTDPLEAVQQRKHRDTRDVLGTGTSSRRRCQYQEGQEARECCKNTQNKYNRCFCTTILFNSQDWYCTGHGSYTPLQNVGDKPMMDLAQSLQTLYVHTLADMQTWYVRTQSWYEHVEASICADEVVLTVAQRPSWYSDTYPETQAERGTETDSC